MSAGGVRLSLTNANVSLTIRTIDAALERLKAEIDHNDCVIAELSSDFGVDVCGIQLLIAAKSYAEQRGRQFRLAEPASGALRQLLDDGGFLNGADPAARAFWLNAETAQ